MAMQANAVPPLREDAPERKRDPRIGAVPSRRVLGMRVDATSYRQAAETILALAEPGAGGITCVATVHMVMEAHDSESFRKLVNAAELVTPDGVPLVWMLRALGLPQAQRVYARSLPVGETETDLGHLVGNGVGRPIHFAGGAENFSQCIADILYVIFHLPGWLAVIEIVQVDDAAGVNHIVRRIENTLV